MTADGDGEKSTFRWLDAARYTVAAVVTVLIFAVVVIGIKVVLRPDSLRLSVVGGSVYSTPQPAREVVTLELDLRAENPSGRVRMYFLNITAYLFENKTMASMSKKPEDECIIKFNPTDEAVPQQQGVDSMSTVQGENDADVMTPSYFDMLYTKRSIIGDMALRVEGLLVTEVRSGINRTGQRATYYCSPLLVGGNRGDEASKGRKDVACPVNLGSQSNE